ncbi:MAG: hypothetical protein WBH14_11455 [Albidovulum sp.]
MSQNHSFPSQISGAASGRRTLSAAILVAMGLSSSFLLVIAGFAVALTMVWPG